MYDTIVIGAGPSGMTAALYAARSNLKVALIERGIYGGQMQNTADIENYPGYATISGPDLSDKMFEPLDDFGVEHVFGDVIELVLTEPIKIVRTTDETYQAKTVILAMGCQHRLLGIPGEEMYNSRGVSYCAVCDGAFFKDKDLFVVGGGDSAVEEAVYLTQYAKSVTIVHRRDSFRAQKILQERALSHPKISVSWNTIITAIKGDDRQVTHVILEDVVTQDRIERKADGIFIYVGLIPNTELLKTSSILDDGGWIITDNEMQTALPGVYAVGDIRQKHLRQITTAVGDGAVAGKGAYDYVISHQEEQI